MLPDWELKEGWGTVLLLILMLLCVSLAIQAARWTEGLAVLPAVVVAGAVAGTILAKSRSPGRTAHLLSGLLGFAWGAYLTSTALGDATGLFGLDSVVQLQLRLEDWLIALVSGETPFGGFIFLLFLTWLLWLVAYVSAWAIFRRQRVWWAVIVSTVAFLINYVYAQTNLTFFLVAFLLVALLLVVRASVAHYQSEWQMARVSYSTELVGGFLRAGLAISILAMGMAWVTPKALASRPMQTFWDRVAEPWRRLQDESSRIFPDLNYQTDPAVIGLARVMRFGGPVSLGDTPVLEIASPAGRYWRNRVYHTYTGDGWINDDPETFLLDANARQLAVPPFEQRIEVTQTITMYFGLGLDGSLVAASQPLWVDLPVRAISGYITQEEEAERARDTSIFPYAPGDPSLLYPRRVVPGGSSYEIVSSLSTSNEKDLRSAGTKYPSWIVPRYLQLPNSLPERVRLLAKEITTGQETPYDAVIAVRDYLRRIRYDESIPGPGPNQDGVDYFLFEERAGYCTYYASAMTVMLRAVGIPARYVEGYSQQAARDGVYHVRELDGHSWTEVFFPRYGWVEFEPTGADPINVRAVAPDDAALPVIPQRTRPISDIELTPEPEGRFNTGTEDAIPRQPLWQRLGIWGWTGLGLAGVGFLATVALVVRRRRQVEGLSAAERIYDDLVGWARRLFQIQPLDHQTPLEYAGVVAVAVPGGTAAIEQIADYYVQERFGGKEISTELVTDAWRAALPSIFQSWIANKTARIRAFWQLFVPPKPEDLT
jgi:hypothetical protein